MLPIEVEVAGTMCDAGCSVFSQTADRLPPVTAGRSPQVWWAEATSLAASEKCVYQETSEDRDECLMN